MEFRSLIEKRRSIRRFTGAALPDGALETILSAGNLANSAKNRQKWAFVAVTEKPTLEAMVPACRNQAFIGEAGAAVAVCSTEDYTMSCGNPAHFIDCAIALDHMQLCACDIGLGSCWLGAFDQAAAREVLGVPLEITIVGILVIGIPAEEGRPKSRVPLEDIVHRNKW